MNCSSCHSFGAGGGALSSGKFAPSLDESTDREIYAAMLTGPQNMPVFGDNQLSPQEKRDIIAYVQNMKADADPGGLGIGRIGPVSEGLVIFLVGMVVLIFATLVDCRKVMTDTTHHAAGHAADENSTPTTPA